MGAATSPGLVARTANVTLGNGGAAAD